MPDWSWESTWDSTGTYATVNYIACANCENLRRILARSRQEHKEELEKRMKLEEVCSALFAELAQEREINKMLNHHLNYVLD